MITLNLNGIRSAAAKGFLAWADSAGADCMGVQELKAVAADVDGRFDHVAGMRGHFHYAGRRGYSGVGVYAKKAPSAVIAGFGNPEFDAEGRWVEARFDTAKRKLSIISCYFPSGSSGPLRQEAKLRFLTAMEAHLERLMREREFILVGDVNIAHNEIDLRNWRANRMRPGFTPDERAWLTKLLAAGVVDVFRKLNPHPDQYTWWSNRGQAWAKNVGWRIDYQLATPGIAKLARREHIYLGERFSDHAPLLVDYAFRL